jgi:hypothetical protein
MSITRKIQLVIGIIGIILPVTTLFIPFYETVLMSHQIQIPLPGLLYSYNLGEFSIGVISGTGSFYAFINIPFCLVLSLLVLINKPNTLATILLGIFFIISSFLVKVGCSSGFGKPFGDTMLIGYRILWLTETALLGFSIFYAAKNKRLEEEMNRDF